MCQGQKCAGCHDPRGSDEGIPRRVQAFIEVLRFLQEHGEREGRGHSKKKARLLLKGCQSGLIQVETTHGDELKLHPNVHTLHDIFLISSRCILDGTLGLDFRHLYMRSTKLTMHPMKECSLTIDLDTGIQKQEQLQRRR